MRLTHCLFCLVFIVVGSQDGFSQRSGIVDKIYPEAYDIETNRLEKEKIEFDYYKVKDAYPSVKVYEFYANILESMNYEEMHWEHQHLGKWFSFIDATIPENPMIYEFRAIWADVNKKEMFILSLRYYSKSGLKKNEPDNNIQHVSFQKRPYLILGADMGEHP